MVLIPVQRGYESRNQIVAISLKPVHLLDPLPVTGHRCLDSLAIISRQLRVQEQFTQLVDVSGASWLGGILWRACIVEGFHWT